MATLTKQDRIDISSALVGTGDSIANADKAIVETAAAKVLAEEKDATNKKFLDERTVLIDQYQAEAAYLDGITRTVLTETLIDNSARRLPNNTFYPADPNTPLPSISDGVWKYFIPFARTHAVGKTNLEVYSATGGRTEQDIIDDINTLITTIEGGTIANNATGQECVQNTCVGGLGGETDAGTCTTNGGTWTPPQADSYQADTTVTTWLNDLKTLVTEWETRLDNEAATIPSTDSNSTRTTQNTTANADITAAKSVIDAWQAVQDFDTATSLPTGNDGAACTAFAALTEGSLQQAKLQPTTLSPLKAELTARGSFITTRLSQLTGSDYLGTVVQDMADGKLTTTTGLYGERMLFLNMRIGVINGTLSKVIGLESAGNIQNQSKDDAINTGVALGLVMTASKLAAPGLNTFYLNLKDASSFSANDMVYVVADEQEELSGSIEEISGNRVKLTFKVPKKYGTDNNARIYKLL